MEKIYLKIDKNQIKNKVFEALELIEFEIGETDTYLFREDKDINAKVFYDEKGLREVYCDLHKKTQLTLSLYDEFTGVGYDYDMPECPRCVELNIKEYDDMDQIRVPIIKNANEESIYEN